MDCIVIFYKKKSPLKHGLNDNQTIGINAGAIDNMRIPQAGVAQPSQLLKKR